jgi:fructan beta-fructosidase
MTKFLLFLTLATIVSCSTNHQDQSAQQEHYRPKFHFTPEKNWTNDPNGLVWFDGEYHLFYQYNPYANKWGHMSWGHAVSKDLITWEHLPVAIEEYTDVAGDSIMIFSGSAVVSGDTIVAIYTSHTPTRQNQSIAYSIDKGRTFKRYEGNPVLDIGRKDFRDPKVFWYGPDKKWVMAVVIPDKHKVQLHGSKDLKHWNLLSEFGPLGDTTKIWECPDLFPLNDKWVMLLSGSHPQGGPYVGMQYFVGDFDGTTFTADDPDQYPLYVDYGKDFYAGVTYNNEPNNRRVIIGWANNWAYAGDIPTSPWKGMMALPRELTLDGIMLKQTPITKVQPMKVSVSATDSVQVLGAWIGYDENEKVVYLDRRNAGNTSFHKSFPGIEKAPARLIDGKVQLDIYVDQSIIEVYINGGEAVITEQVFPNTR